MKKIVTLILCAVLLLALAVPTFAVEEEFEGIMEVLPINTFADKIVIDGKMEDGEWGDPVYTTTPQDVLKNENYGWAYWSFNEIPTSQRVEIYVTNDGDSIYVACKLIGAAYDAGADDPAKTYDHAHFGFTAAPYTEGTVVPRILFKEQTYEHYTHYVFATVDGQKWSDCGSQGMKTIKLEKENYEISYDRATRTYTYEVRVPFSYTNVDMGKSGNVVMSFNVGDAHGEKGANRYMISMAAEQAWNSMGAGNFTHGKTNPLLVQLRSTKEMIKTEFEPTDEEKQSAETMTQSGIISYDAVADTDTSAGMLMTAAIIVAAIAGAVLIFTLIVLIAKKKRS